MGSIDPKRLSQFIAKGQSLRERSNESPLPVEEHNDWVAEMEQYFEEIGKPEYKSRLSDFSGLVFYSDGSDKSKFQKSVDGRVRRLHEFLSELAKVPVVPRDEIVEVKPNFFGVGLNLRAAWKRYTGKDK